jgi:hypothetical protein
MEAYAEDLRRNFVVVACIPYPPATTACQKSRSSFVAQNYLHFPDCFLEYSGN